MRASELRKTSVEFFAMSVDMAKQHAEAAKALASADLPPAARVGLKALAGVQDCMARRYRTWATHLEVAAAEIDELEQR